MQLDTTISERRRHPRTLSHTEAVVKTNGGIFHYDVSNLSASGALLTGVPPLRDGERVEVILRLPLYPEVRVQANVLRCERVGTVAEIALAFVHVDDRTEDHIQSALLSEIERSRTDGLIADMI
ncbi:MAG: PilZ domain-containing protein [Deltaproteobacteria bacterium]|nr:PilZ domain-containing protein [Nannocystaceae bacterium]